MKKIRHTDTLAYHDGIQVFMARDEAGARYVGMLMDSPDGVDRYAVVEVSAESLHRLRTDAPDLRSLLVAGSKDGWYLAQARDDLTEPLAFQEQSGSITDSSPGDGFVLGVLSYMVVQQRGTQQP